MSKVLKGTYNQEAVSGFDHRTAMEEAARCLLCHDAPCSQGCPAGTDPGKFIRSIRFRNPKGAAETIRENNILGASCARVCPYDNLCEEACSRCGIDRPIEIGKLQRYAMEQEKIFKMKILTPPSKKIKKHVACIGAGPASLAVAAELAKVGVKVTVFDNNPKAGGVLSYGITSARLPQKVVDQDVAAVKGLGVKFELSKEIGLNIDVNEMLEKKDYDAIFIGTGLWESKKLGIEGEQSLGVVSSIDFLRYAKDRKGVDFIKGQRVLVIGGGDVAMDCASAAVLSGAASTAIWYRRTIAEAPAQIAEIEYVTKLGVGITTGYAPTKITGSSDGLWVEFLGRDGKSTANVNVDCLVTAIGQVPRDHSNFLPGNIDAKGDIIAKKDGSTKIKGVFAAGDIVNGGKTVVEAVAGGKIAAAEILKYLGVEV